MNDKANNAFRQRVPSHRLLLRLTALAALCIICLQLSRSFLVIPLNSYLCAIPGHDHNLASVADHDHDEESANRRDDGGNSVEHCKDELGGVISIAAVPFMLTQSVSLPILNRTSAKLLDHSATELAGMQTLPYRPPRPLCS